MVLFLCTYNIPNKTCTYSVSATIEGNKSVSKNINYKLRPESTVDFGMKSAVLASDTKQITVKLTDKVNADTVVKEMFTVVDDLERIHSKQCSCKRRYISTYFS